MLKRFKYKEDRDYFESMFLELGGLDLFIGLFDFRDVDEKRKEFNSMRNKIFDGLVKKYGSECQLKCHKDCTNLATVVDHLMPLSSNRLNKEIRGMKAAIGKKVPTQSLGSNDICNFVLSCTRCNAFKQNRIPDTKLISRIYSLRNHS